MDQCASVAARRTPALRPGAWFTYRQQRDQREHDDLVRFHDERLETYVELSDATASALSAAARWMKKPEGLTLRITVGEHIGRVNAAHARVRILGSKPVTVAAFQLVKAFTYEPFVGDVDAQVDVGFGLNLDFEEAVRAELGITKPT